MIEEQYGKIPPQAIDLEEAVLGSLILESQCIIDIVDFIFPDVFYKDFNKIIYKSIKEMYDRSEPIDLLTVTNNLKNSNELDLIGGGYYLVQLTNHVKSVTNIEFHARIIYEKYLKRELIRISNNINKMAFDDSEDVYDIISKLSNEQETLLKEVGQNAYHIQDCVKDLMVVMDNNSKGLTSGIPSGFSEYDKFTKGEQNGDLVIIAGETSQGKTALALCKAFNQALMGYNVAIFSYEMSRNQITARLMALATDISAKKLLMDELQGYEWEQVHAKITKLIESNIYIIEVERNNFDWLKSKIKTIKSKFNIDSIIIDYVQLITVNGLKRNEQIGHIANGLKFLAKHKNINIPITLLSQLKRDERPQPTLSRLKESGDIENAADIVIGIWRPEHYGIESIDIWASGASTENISTSGIGVMEILKGRNTGLKTFIMNWMPHLTKYSDYKPIETPF